jgi:hypothetical protein
MLGAVCRDSPAALCWLCDSASWRGSICQHSDADYEHIFLTCNGVGLWLLLAVFVLCCYQSLLLMVAMTSLVARVCCTVVAASASELTEVCQSAAMLTDRG